MLKNTSSSKEKNSIHIPKLYDIYSFIMKSLHRRFIKKIDVQPPDRLRLMQDMMKEIERKEQGPCGGYSIMYACMCDYHNTPYREEVAWVGIS